MNQFNKYSAVILAADRGQNDSVAHASNVACKALAPVRGVAMLDRVLEALHMSVSISGMVVSGPIAFLKINNSQLPVSRLNANIQWIENKQTPSNSAYHAMQMYSLTTPVLVTTSDVPFLTASIVEYFCTEASSSNADLTVGFVDYKLVKQRFPDLPKTTFKCRDGAYCGCNLFAFNSSNSRKILNLWQEIDHQRKHPLNLIRILGWRAVIKYILKLSTLNELLESISDKLGISIAPILVPFPEAAVDVDTAEDWEFVQTVDLKNN